MLSTESRADAPEAHHAHAVQFYESEEFLAGIVADYVAQALLAGHPAALIATPARRAAVSRRLRALRIPAARLQASGRLAWHDAASTLATFMQDGMPDRASFRATIEPVLAAAAAAAPGQRLHAYGEMVNLLVAAGNPRAAIALEDLWNELAAGHGFTLLCAYDMSCFRTAGDAEAFHEVCGVHAHVVPAERYTMSAGDARASEVARLQQRAVALEAEVAHARELEGQLRAALEEQRRAEAERRAMDAHLREVQRLESIGVLAGGIAHDFNNLLACILGNAELLATQAPAGSEARTLAEEILLAGRRSADLTRQLLAYAGRGQFVLATVDVSAIAREVATLLRSAIPAGGTLALEVPTRGLSVRGDRGQLAQVAMNLVMNAAEALEGRPGLVELTVDEVELSAADVDRLRADPLMRDATLAPGAYARLTVRDTGCGIPDEVRARIFDPFFTTKPSGRGLGLAATCGIVHAHGGALAMHSVSGSGTSFRVWLPLDASAEAVPDGPAAPPAQGTLVRGRCLLADDEPVVRRIVARLLALEGWEVVEAGDGEEALARFDALGGAVELALLDLTMPVCGGLEAMRELRARAPSLPIVLMSGYADEPVTGSSAAAAASAFLAKPFARAELVAMLAEVAPASRR